MTDDEEGQTGPGDLYSEERSRIDEFLRQRMGELSGGFGRDEKE